MNLRQTVLLRPMASEPSHYDGEPVRVSSILEVSGVALWQPSPQRRRQDHRIKLKGMKRGESCLGRDEGREGGGWWREYARS